MDCPSLFLSNERKGYFLFKSRKSFGLFEYIRDRQPTRWKDTSCLVFWNEQDYQSYTRMSGLYDASMAVWMVGIIDSANKGS